jgi:group I intron endonuclease
MTEHQGSNQSSGIYRITNTITGVFYIGSSVDIKRRWTEHRNTLSAGRHFNTRLQASWIKHGPTVFTFEVIEYCIESELINREQSWLDTTATQDRYNQLPKAFSHLGAKRSPETIERMRVSFKTRKRPGPHTAAHKANIAAALKGKKRTPEQVHAMKERMRGIPLPKSALQASIVTRAGRTYRHTDEARRKMSAFHSGRKPSIETRAKMRMAKLGTTVSAETRMKMSLSQKSRRSARKENNEKQLRLY